MEYHTLGLFLQLVELFCKPRPMPYRNYLYRRYASYLVLLSKAVPNEENLEIPMFFGMYN